MTEKKRWHLWYDDYGLGTAFITDESYQETTDPHVIIEGIPYDVALRMVNEHNEGLPPPVWHYTPDPKKEK